MPLLIASRDVSVPVAVLCLTSTLSLQAFCYAGFHAYVQVTLQHERYQVVTALLLVTVSASCVENLSGLRQYIAETNLLQLDTCHQSVSADYTSAS